MQKTIRLRKCVRPIEAVTEKCIIAGSTTTTSATSISSIDGDNATPGLCQKSEKSSSGKSTNEDSCGKRYVNATSGHNGVATPRRAAKKDFSDNFPPVAG